LIFSPFKTTFRISTLSLRSGIPISKASGRRWRIASSSSEGQLVAASTITCAFSIRILSMNLVRPGP